MSDDTRYLTVRQTAARLAVHENTVRNWAREGLLPSARLPGARTLRFDERDVERLARHRGEGVVSVGGELRTVGPELIDAAQLDQWARDSVVARYALPDLIRRLLVATRGVSGISGRTGTGVSFPGWDCRASALNASFLPNGPLLFEFGAGAQPKVKADEVYEARKLDPVAEDAARSTFIFVTPRRWRDGSKWAAQRRAEAVFLDVRVLDADDLEGWLQATPAVHYWISEELGRRPHDAQTLDLWWSAFRSQTEPPLPEALFLAGRADEQKRLAVAVRSDPSVTVVRAASRDDALAFVFSALQAEPSAMAGRQLLLVRTPEAWNRIGSGHGRMVLMPLFLNPDSAGAVANGHHVILIADRTVATGGPAIDLPAFNRESAHAALQAAGIEFKEAHRLAALARRSLPAFVRDLAQNPQLLVPPWATDPGSSAVLAPLTLLGEWSDSVEDRAIVERVTGFPWVDVERHLVRWSGIDDPPFVRSGSIWHAASAAEAFRILGYRISLSDWQRWHDAVIEVLLEADPTLEIPPDKRPMAAVLGARRKHSRTLRNGIAQGLAIAGSCDPASDREATTSVDQAQRVVGEVLARANRDQSGSAWCALADVLPLLAEAAPPIFLEAVHHDLDRANPLLASTFQDRNTSALATSSPHTGLLWALETLSWSPDHIIEACRALARLDQLDHPRGSWANRPLESLASILVGWIRHTSAPLELRIETVGVICRETPETGWLLLMKLWPEAQSTCMPPNSPRFQTDWKPDGERVLMPEYARFVAAVVELALKNAGQSGERWADLGERVSTLAPNDQNQVLEFLERVAIPETLEPVDRIKVWERLQAYVASHRRFAAAEWALRGPALDRLEIVASRFQPVDVIRFAYLFDWHPDLADVPPEDHDAYEKRLKELREAAAREAVQGGVDAIAAIAQRSAVPSHLGWTVGDISNDALTPNLAGWLDSPEWNLRETASAWARRNVEKRGVAWLRATYSLPELQPESRRIALAHSAPAAAETWALLKELDGSLHDRYWRETNVWRVSPSDVESAARELLARDRAWVTIPLLARNIRQVGSEVAGITPDLVRDALDAAIATLPPKARDQSLGYEVGRLLDYLESLGAHLPRLVVYEFRLFQLLEHHRQPRALRQALSASPGFFVELVKLVYRAKHESEREPNPGEAALARHAWLILHEGGFVPGMRGDGSLDEQSLADWVTTARMALSEIDRADIGDEEIGRALSSSPVGSDGVWPAEPVRRVVESVASAHLETGIVIGVINGRGITSRGPYDGGAQESALATKYLDWSRRTATEWRRTSRLLRRIADDYQREAREMDSRAKRSADRD